MPDPIRITTADLQRPEVSDYVDMQTYLSRDVGALGNQPWVLRVIYANWFYLSIAAMLGGLAGWACLEPWYDDNLSDDVPGSIDVINFFIFPTVTACIGLFLGAAEGLMCRNLGRALRCGAVGLGVGFVGGLLVYVPTEMLFGLMGQIAFSLSDDPQPDVMPTGLALLVLAMGRGAAWAFSGIPAGMGQGIALREKKIVINGLVGGLLGGLVGGLLFDPIYLVLTSADGQATYSRAVGFAAIGLFVGLFVGLVEGWTNTHSNLK